jgi:phage terminase small subunit
MCPAPRKSLAAHELSGAIKKNPARFVGRKDQPRSAAGIGAAPKHLTAEEKVVWRDVVKVSPKGVLTAADRLLLEVTCHLVVHFRSGAVIRASEVAMLLAALGRLGLSPADRAKLNVQPEPPKPDDDKYAFLS